jgi:antitoxin ParD1/3/4
MSVKDGGKSKQCQERQQVQVFGKDNPRGAQHQCTPCRTTLGLAGGGSGWRHKKGFYFTYMATLAKNWRTWYGTGTMDRRYETMQTMNISLPDTLKHFIDAQVAAGGYSSASEYVRALVRDDQKRQARVRLETLLLEALDSGDPTVMTKADWDAIRREGLARLRARSTPPPEATP